MKRYNRKFITLNPEASYNNWSNVIVESTGLDLKKDDEKISWMSVMMNVTENTDNFNINETYGSQNPEMMPGIRATVFPSDPGNGVGAQDGAFFRQNYQQGSGDIPQAKLGMAMNIAAYTIGLELLPVIPMELPSMMYSYLDHVYADSNLTEDSDLPSFIQINGDSIGTANFNYNDFTKGDNIYITQLDRNDAGTADAIVANSPAIRGIFYKKHRVNGDLIIKVEATGTIAANGAFTADGTSSISDVTSSAFVGANSAWIAVGGTTTAITALSGSPLKLTTGSVISTVVTNIGAELVNSLDEHIPEYSNNSATISENGPDRFSATRAQGENGTENAISLRTFSTAIEAGTVEVIGNLTKTQLKDLQAYGQDPINEIYKAAQNELTQTINRDVLRTLFRLGVTAHANLKAAQGVDLNLYLDTASNTTKALNTFGLTEFVDIVGRDRTADFPDVANKESNSSAENQYTRQRRIYSTILAAKNIIANISRQGAGNFAVVNTQVASAMMDIKGFMAAPMENSIAGQQINLYFIGSIMGVNIYCDPLMIYTDTRILIGRKGTETDSGLKFFVYQLADSIETISETSMAPKISVTSRYSLVPVGFFPESNYITVGAFTGFGGGFI